MQIHPNELIKIKKEISDLKESVENISTLLNRGLIKELEEESDNIKNGEYLTEDEFKKNHLLN
jgi:hypothetical protein